MCRKLIFLTTFVLMLSVALTSVADAALPGLIGWWKLDEMAGTIAFDSSVLGNDGTLGPEGNPQWVAGIRGGALELDGNDDYVEINSIADDITNNNFSVSAWIKTTQTNDGTVIGSNTTGGSHDFVWGVINGNHLVEADSLNEYPPKVADNQWHHIAYVRDGNKAYAYTDGVQVGTETPSGNPSGQARWSIGQEWDSNPSDEYNGIVDDVQIYNRPLTAAEIQEVMKGIPPGVASNPSPEDEAIDVPREVVLSWTPGEFAPPVNGHKIYLSENFNDVNDGIGGVTQSASSYSPPQRLDLNTTYYWRVDEVDGAPDYTVYEGSVWSFTTELFTYPIENITATASSQSTNLGVENVVNGSGLDESSLLHGKVGDDNMWLSDIAGPQPSWIEFEFDKVYKLHELWVWNSNGSLEPIIGFGFKDVTIEYSANGTDYTTLGTTAEFARAPGAPDYEHNTTIDMGGVPAKYVRLTANSNWGGILPQFGLSEVRFFYIPVNARKPYPDSGATGVPPDVVLGWVAGREAVTHDVYVSTDEQTVIDGTAPVATVTETSYGPLSLDLDVTHYWKVNEVNEAETLTTWESNIWSFTTTDNIVVDDFESYNDLDPGDPDSKRIFNVWIDGYGIATNGSVVGYENPPFCEQATVHGGGQSMPLFYDNTAGAAYSEAELTLSPPQDWSKHGVRALSLWFYGDPNNGAEQMYVKLNGSKVVYDGDAGDIKKTRWQQWNIDLASFGASLQNITKISVGFGDDTTTTPGGSGKMLIDDIWLYPPRCLTDIGKPQGDVNNDCVVDHLDLEIMAAGWLESDSAIPAVAPSPAEMVVHYKLDGNASDSSGNNNHGMERAGPTYVAGKFGQAINLDGLNDYVAIQNFHYESTAGLTGVTVAAWIRTSVSSNQMIVSFDRNEYWRLQIAGEAGGPGLVGWEVYTDTGQVDTGQAANWPANTGRVDDGQWHHVAGVFDNGTLTIYIDGIAKEPYSGGPTLGRGRNVRYGYLGVGSESTSFDAEPRTPANFFDGALDEVYIYHRALTAAEIAHLADETPGDGELYVPVPSVANMSDEEPPLSRSVNFKDYALLADQWLEEQLWPQP